MSDNDAWDADDYEPPAAAGGKSSGKAVNDKWDGEDEDDDVKDAWDADSEEEKSKEEEANKAAPKAAASKKKKLRDKIALKEAALQDDDEDDSLKSPEDKLAEKLRLQKMEENAQFNLTRDMLGLKTGSIDAMVPETKEDFEAFAKAICEKMRIFSSSDHYNELLETVSKDLALDMPVPTLKRVKIHVEGLHSTRLKEEKANKNKKGKASKGTSLKNDLDKDLFGGGGGVGDYGDEMDDFM